MTGFTIATRINSARTNPNSADGTIYFCLSPHFTDQPLSRTFRFIVTDFHRPGGLVTIREPLEKGGHAVLDSVSVALLEDPMRQYFPAEDWRRFSPTQLTLIRIILLGVRQAMLSQWGLVRDVTSHEVNNITKGEIATIQFPPDGRG